jgi:hypothetical protein
VIALWRNKGDLVPDSERVGEFLEEYSGHVDCRAVVSAKTNDGVSAAFEECFSLAISRRQQADDDAKAESDLILPEMPQSDNGACAC